MILLWKSRRARLPTWGSLALAVLAAALTAAAIDARSERLEPRLASFYARWLGSVEHLITDAERRVFATLEDDVYRELFIHRFWQARGALGGELAARHRRGRDEAARRFHGPRDARARALIVAGKPPRVARLACETPLRRLEVWAYDDWHARLRSGRDDARGFVLLFYLHSFGEYRQWSRADGTAALLVGGAGRGSPATAEIASLAAGSRCLRARGDRELLAAALANALGPTELRRWLAPPPADAGWLERFRSELDATRASAAALPAAPLEIRFPGRYNDQRTILEGRVALPVDGFELTAEGQLFDRVEIVGDVFAGDRLTDTFRVVHYLAGAPPADGVLRLSFYRRLRPGGPYRLSVRVADDRGLGLLRETRAVDVPRLTEDAAPPPGSRLGFAGLTREEVGVLTTLPSVELIDPGDDLFAGAVELTAVTTGGPVARVAFFLDGRPAAEDDAPPFTVIVDLGSAPVRHAVEARALDPAGRELARDRLLLNATPPRFDVRLVEPAPGAVARRAVVEVDVPAGERLERLEVWLDRRLLATLREPPFIYPLPEIPFGETHYVRAVATLASGAALEDLVIVSTRAPVDRLDVQLVEVYASVIDRRGRPVGGLVADDFAVYEDGLPQRLERFDTVADLPLSIALLMDVSASMRRKVEVAAASARRFFEQVLRPGDGASLLTFNHDLARLVPFTADVARLRYAATDLRPHGTTRLHDGIVYAVHGFGGLDGKRALVVLSDGQDVDSDFAFPQVEAYALRSGVAIYPILLDLEAEEVRGELERLAEQTGGRFFAVATAGELDGVYRRIEEDLRSQYLLVYRPPPITRRDFRRVEVRFPDRPDLRAHTIHGYYP